MYFHLVCSPESFTVVSGRKSTRKLFSQVSELMVSEGHEFVGNSVDPPFTFPPYPFLMGILLPFG